MTDTKLSPRETLRALRMRAGVSQSECAEVLGFNGGTGYGRYENDTKYDVDLLPVRVISKLLPLFVGKGVPPIESDELWNISDAAPAFEAADREINERTMLGKIAEVRIGFGGGGSDDTLGVTLHLSGPAWGCVTFLPLETPADLAELRRVMDEAKIRDAVKLVRVPICATFHGNALKTWRVLTECL